MSKIVDKQFQILQFKTKTLLMSGLEFQGFFEELMKKNNPLFRKIPSGGGDGGNDGWIKETGTYYQVYSPVDTTVKDSDAAKKLVDDFNTLQENWDQVKSIKEYFFVYNDKYNGAQKPEIELAELEKKHPNINFKLLLLEDLEAIFIKLSDENKYELGFHIDKRQLISFIENVLVEIEKNLDKDNVDLSSHLIKSVEKNIKSLSEDNLTLEIKLLNAKIKEKNEDFEEANNIYQELINNKINDVRPYLHLAENKLRVRDLSENKNLLDIAEKIDNSHWLLEIEKIVKAINLDENIDLSNVDEKNFPEDSSIKANYYRLYSILFWRDENDSQAKIFLNKSLALYPEKLLTRIQEIEYLSQEMITSIDPNIQIEKNSELLKKIEDLFLNFPNITNRNKSNVKIHQLLSYRISNNFKKLELTAKEIFNLLITCHFDNPIDNMLATLLQNVSIPKTDLDKLQKYITTSSKSPSDRLCMSISFQFCLQKNLYVQGLSFFKKIKNKKYTNLIESLKTNDFQQVETILKKDKELTIFIAQSLKEDSKNRIKVTNLLVEKFPELQLNKEKLLLLIDIDDGNVKSALKRVENIGISNFEVRELGNIVDVLHKKEAWELEIIALKELIKNESDLAQLVNYKVRLFNALLNLKNCKDAAKIGQELLTTEQYNLEISERNNEVILSHTILCLIQRSIIDSRAFNKAEELLNKINTDKFSIEFLIGVKAELYLVQKKPKEVISTVVQAAKTKKVFTQEEYAKLYFLFTRLSNLKGLDLNPSKKISKDSFIKFEGDDNWIYFGDDENLDAIKLKKTNKIFNSLNEKLLGDEIEISGNYSSNVLAKKIELIFPIEKYIFWKSVYYFHKLANEDLLEGVVKIETPENEEGIDLQYLLKFMEDQEKRKAPFFDIYLKKRMPFAFLALSEGSIENAIGKIQHEQMGFINCSTGDLSEFQSQKDNLQALLKEKKPLYLDSTSALVLSEFGLIDQLFSFYSDIKVPQSVVNFLLNLADKFNFDPGQAGYMGYARGNIILSPVDEKKHDKIKDNFKKSIEIIESDPSRIEDISFASKQNCFSERELLPESVDACILAQKNHGYLLTDDYIYLHVNNFETKKPIPKHFSSIALVRAMYESGCIKFEEYLKFFSYLSSYRYRFLHFDVGDIEKAVFGDGKIRIISTENIQRLNFGLTLSTEYGVTFENAFKLIAIFLCKSLEDDSTTPEIIKSIFTEIVNTFPTKLDKREFADLLSSTCINVIRSKKSKIIIQYPSKIMDLKITEIEQLAKSWPANILISK